MGGPIERDNWMTRRLLADASVAAGMNVLEVSCGNGEVTRLLAELVGPDGRVLALDRDQGMLAQARERLGALGYNLVRCLQVDLTGDLMAQRAPRLIAAGVADREEIDVIAAKLEEESSDPTGVYISEMSFGAWALKP